MLLPSFRQILMCLYLAHNFSLPFILRNVIPSTSINFRFPLVKIKQDGRTRTQLRIHPAPTRPLPPPPPTTPAAPATTPSRPTWSTWTASRTPSWTASWGSW